jgi:ABC-2 type transport system ATP-binding protein
LTAAILADRLSRRYRDERVLDNISFEIEAGSITGLLGRNGAGKTTLLRILSGQEFPSSGSVTMLGRSPLENDHLLGRMVFIREDQQYPEYTGRRGGWGMQVRVRHALKAAASFYPNWNADLAEALLAEFSLPVARPVSRLSRGMHSALGIIIALAARAEVTLFDEPYAGLDPVARKVFYNRLLADYADHPRTVLLSTHFVDEAVGLLERVLVIDRGHLVLDAPADDVRGAATSVSGPALAVADFTAGRTVWERRQVFSQETAVVAGPLDDIDHARAKMLRLHLEPLTPQEVVVFAAKQAEARDWGRTGT